MIVHKSDGMRLVQTVLKLAQAVVTDIQGANAGDWRVPPPRAAPLDGLRAPSPFRHLRQKPLVA